MSGPGPNLRVADASGTPGTATRGARRVPGPRTRPPKSKTARSRGAVRSFSTPIPAGATKRGDGSLTLTIRDVTVIILPDTTTRSAKLRNRARTSVTPRYSRWSARTDGKDVVTSYVLPTVTLTIQTTYGPGSDPDAPSGYGKGPTLRDHEGSHGTDFLEYLRANPLPEFKGGVGISAREFEAHMEDWFTEANAYVKAMDEHSEKLTDCTGKTKASFCPADP
jgi:hypothetical protein